MKQKIDKLFINGKIYTFIEENDTVEAVAVNKGYIIWTGLTKNALEKFDPAETIDLEGKAMEPSMGDSHLHFYAYNQTLFTVDLGGITTRAEAWAKLKAKCRWESPMEGSMALPSRSMVSAGSNFSRAFLVRPVQMM